MYRRSWSSGLRSLPVALAQLAAAAVAIAATEIVLFTGEGVAPLALIAAFPLVGLLYLAAGVVTWLRRPGNRTGALLCWCALAVLAAAAGNATIPALNGAGLIAAELPIGILIHLLLAFPSGRLPDARSRWLAGGGYVVTVGLQAPRYLFADGSAPAWLTIGRQPTVVRVFTDLKQAAGLAVIVLVAVLLLGRLRRASVHQRPALTSVAAYGVATLLFLTLSANLASVLRLSADALFAAQLVVFAGVPGGFALALLRGGFARAGEIEELGAWLGAGHHDQAGLRTALATALGDPSADLLLWLPEAASYVDARGGPVVAPAAGRGMVEIQAGRERVGVISYDAALIADADIVRKAGQVIALAVQREQLTAALRASRSRIAATADAERRRIAADLHDGLQGQLVVLALQAGQLAAQAGQVAAHDGQVAAHDGQVAPHDGRLAAGRAGTAGTEAAATELRRGLEAAISELRALVHGVMPALLMQRGLPAAVQDLLDHTPLPSQLDASGAFDRVPAAVESAAYFVAAEALANCVKHAGAGKVSVQLAHTGRQLEILVSDDGCGGARAGPRGGLRGMTDRVDALGGQLHLASARGHGTQLRAEFPCG
jgi:signal transduction histidine kinase